MFLTKEILFSSLFNLILCSLSSAINPKSQDESQKRTLSEPNGEKEPESMIAYRRTTKLKYGHLEGVHLDKNYVKGSLWPKPYEETREDVYFELDCKAFKFNAVGKNSDILRSALKRYRRIVFPKTTDVGQGTLIKELDVNVKTEKAELSMGMDESCKFEIGLNQNSGFDTLLYQ